ncbi:MAG: hypothetical protein IJV07_04720 [Alphaproteobacteria bacterium]|nr:hypothetical protein [Alphaproteobacteria bacterium]
MIRNFVKNKTLCCLLAFASLCQVAKSQDGSENLLAQLAEEVLGKDWATRYEKKEISPVSDNHSVVEPPEGYLGKYNLKTGEPILEPEERAESPIPAPAEEIEKPVTALAEDKIDINGMTFYIGPAEQPSRFLPSPDEKDADLAYRPDSVEKNDYNRYITMHPELWSEPMAMDIDGMPFFIGTSKSSFTEEKPTLSEVARKETSVQSTDDSLDDLLERIESGNSQKPPVQEDLVQLLADLEEMGTVPAETVTAPTTVAAGQKAVIDNSPSVPSTAIVLETPANSVLPKQSDTAEIQPDLKDLLADLDDHAPENKIKSDNSNVSSPALDVDKIIVRSTTDEVEAALTELEEMDKAQNSAVADTAPAIATTAPQQTEIPQETKSVLANNTIEQPITTTQDQSTVARSNVTAQPANDRIPAPPVVAHSGQSDLDELLAFTENKATKNSNVSNEKEPDHLVSVNEQPLNNNEVKTPAIARSTKADLEELLALTAQEPQKTDSPSNPFWGRLGQTGRQALNWLAGFSLIGLACGIIKGITHKAPHQPAPAQTPVPVREAIPEPEVKAEVAAQQQQQPLPDLFRKEEVHSQEQKKELNKERKELAERLWAEKALESIKKERAQLTRQMAKAVKENNTAEIDRINARRQELKLARKKAFERAADPYLSQIKEERRRLTKQMTIAKRAADQQAMATVTEKRNDLKLFEKQLKTNIRTFNYTKRRITFLRQQTIQYLNHQREYSRAAA